jgi:lipoprotein-anchoring transpeptidase ErfK/SrfK
MELLALVPRAATPAGAAALAADLAAPERVPTAAAHSVMEYILEQEKLRYPIPEDTGEGRRIIYSNRGQRVWLVEADGSLHDTYLISGRRGVPDPGTYRVYSKSEKAVAGHDGITMDWMVRFAWSDSGVRIGFHDIPKYADGSDMQTEDELGHYRSGGCVRQDLDHAIALYRWAPLGTPVIVIP